MRQSRLQLCQSSCSACQPESNRSSVRRTPDASLLRLSCLNTGQHAHGLCCCAQKTRQAQDPFKTHPLVHPTYCAEQAAKWAEQALTHPSPKLTPNHQQHGAARTPPLPLLLLLTCCPWLLKALRLPKDREAALLLLLLLICSWCCQ